MAKNASMKTNEETEQTDEVLNLNLNLILELEFELWG